LTAKSKEEGTNHLRCLGEERGRLAEGGTMCTVDRSRGEWAMASKRSKKTMLNIS